MVFRDLSEEQRNLFFAQGYASHLPGYTGHCPSLKFRVGKGFGACTEEILKELLEKKVLKSGPYKPTNFVSENAVLENDVCRRDYKNDAQYFKTPPYILGYTGYIPGFNNIYGLPFMKAVEEGAKEWRETQRKLEERYDSLRIHVEKTDQKNLLSRVRTSNVEHPQNKPIKCFDNRVTPERPPAIGYTGHIPGTKSDVGLSKRYTQAAKKGLEFIFKERENRKFKQNQDVGHTRS